MKVCLIAEGCYPYVVGGVSSWIHSLISAFPEIEFSLIAILADRSIRGKFVYELPENLTEVYEIYLQDLDWSADSKGRENDRFAWMKLKPHHAKALESLVIGEKVQWDNVFDLFRQPDLSIDQLLMSPAFLKIVRSYYEKNFSNITFSDFLWTIRSLYLPLFIAMQFVPPKADVYHCVATGYSGIVGSIAKALYPSSAMLISEHGIYTREREEEIIRAHWVQGIYKDIWIQQFRKMSLCAYQYADAVTSLFAYARELQIELGCPAEKTVITPNGIKTERFLSAPGKAEDDSFINVGAILRITPIKDVKTMISAFHFAQQKEPRLKLWLMGPDDEDPDYAQECRMLIDTLDVQNVEITGRINTIDYIGRMDMTILTSISEGQPLTILESFAVKKPCIATNVGNCYGLIMGENGDASGAAGIVVPVMNINAIAEAILTLARDPQLRTSMGEIGYERLMRKYKIEYMTKTYRELYKRMGRIAGIEHPFGRKEDT